MNIFNFVELFIYLLLGHKQKMHLLQRHLLQRHQKQVQQRYQNQKYQLLSHKFSLPFKTFYIYKKQCQGRQTSQTCTVNYYFCDTQHY